MRSGHAIMRGIGQKRDRNRGGIREGGIIAEAEGDCEEERERGMGEEERRGMN